MQEKAHQRQAKMQINSLAATFFGLTMCLLILSIVSETRAQTPKKIIAHEIALRKKATNIVVPKYPNDAKKAKASGVAVAELTISETGAVLNVKILESPHNSISAAMTEALRQWKFSPFTIKGQPQKIEGKITYYFLLEKKTARVESPY